MRVDFCITELNPGGAERCLTELAIGLAAGGDRVRVISIGRLPRGPQRVLVDRIEAAGIAVQSLNSNHPLRFWDAQRQLRTWIEESPPDIFQSFLHHANVLGSLAARRAGVETVVGGLRVAEPNWLRIPIERWAVRRMSSLVCVSQSVRKFAITKLGCPESKCEVIPNGVDLTRFATATPVDWSRLGWPDNPVVTLFIGRMHPQKGIELLQRQIDRLAPRGSDRRLLLIGEGPLGQSIDRWVKDVGHDRVQRLSWQADVAPFLRSSRLLVLPSRYEGMPNVVLEAMAAGRPVVCSRVEGIAELLQRPEQNFATTDSNDLAQLQSFPADDDTQMAELVERFLADESLSNEIGISNQEFVRCNFSIPAMIDAYRSHYRSLIAQQRDGR